MEPDLTTEELLAALSTNPADRVSLPPDNLMSTERFQDQASFELPPEQLATFPGVPMPGPVPADVMVAGQEIPGRLVAPEVAQAFRGGSEAFVDPLGRFTAPPGLERAPEDRFEGVRELAEKTRRAAFFVSPEVKEARARFDQAERDLKDVEIDPFSFVKDGKSKAMAIVGLVLGEAARGFSGGKLGNVASDLLFKFADMEMKKGIEKKGKLRDLFNLANQRLGNEIAASNMVRDALVRGYQTQLDLGLREMAMEDAAANAAAQIAKDLQISRDKIAAEQEAAASKARERLLPSESGIQKSRASLQQSRDTAVALRRGIQGAEKLVGQVKVRRTALDRAIEAAMRQVAEEGPQVAVAAFAGLSQSLEGAVELRNAIDQIAFGLATEGQSASSISDRDVENFRRILADPKLDAVKIKGFLEHLAVKAEASAAFDEAYMTGRYTAEEADQYARAKVKEERGFDFDPKYGFLTPYLSDSSDPALSGYVQ
jgi:hypothetical protein